MPITLSCGGTFVRRVESVASIQHCITMAGLDLPRALKSPSGRRGTLPRISKGWVLPLFLTLFGAFVVFFRLRNGAQFLYESDREKWQFERRRGGLPATALATAADGTAGTMNSMNLNNSAIGEEFRTHRVGCRTYPKGGQSCVISGIACVDVNRQRAKGVVRPLIYLVDDTRRNGQRVESDRWCSLRHKSADPRYFGPRDWPLIDYFAPRQSCLNAQWRTKHSLLENGSNPNVRWVDEFSLIDLDYVNNNHNNHYLKDIVWLLDVALWQQNIQKSSTLPHGNNSHIPSLFTMPKHILFPQATSDFVKQTGRDVNRINLALVLGLDARQLYRGQKYGRDRRIYTRPFLDAFPESKDRFIFYGDERANSANDLVCTKKLTVGAKLGNMGHERVCTHLRESTWKLYGLSRPALASSGGYLRYHRPPRRVVLLQRHRTRGFRNINPLVTAMRAAAAKYGFEFEYHTTQSLVTAEEHVRFFSRIGVLLTPHGSQAMGGMWMPRHSAIIEAFPPGYTDYAFDLLSTACNLWHYEIQGVVPEDLKAKYARVCAGKMKSFFDQCVQMKFERVQVDIDETVRTVLLALKRLGHYVTP